MTTVFFKLNDVQEKELKQFMTLEGYSNKTEFFRFLIKFYKYQKTPMEQRFENAADTLKKALIALDKKGKMNKSLEDQLNDV
jgi:hypothetical protein